MIFPRLPQWTAASVAAHNALAGLFPSTGDWSRAIAAAFTDLLRYPAGYRIHLTATHRLEPSHAPIQAAVEGTETTLGRDTSCGLVLGESAIRRQHARLMASQGTLYLEDLGSSLGTFVGDRKLTAHVPEALGPGATFTIFPYSIQAQLERIWLPDERLALTPPVYQWTSWSSVARDQLLGCAGHLEPGNVPLWLGVRSRLVQEALRGVYGVEQLDLAGLLETDAGVLDHLLTACLENLNAQLGWPLRIVWGRWGSAAAPFADDDRGLLLGSVLNLRETRGAVALFLPEAALAVLPRRTAAPFPEALAAIPLACRCQLGEIEVLADDAAALAPGDTILLVAAPALWVEPGHLGWICELAGDGNFSALRLDKPLERMDRLNTTDPGPFADVPVLLQVVLARKTFTLGELRQLTPGAVVDLGRGEEDLVELAVNGKVMGSGELVRIDGQLGVRVLGWQA